MRIPHTCMYMYALETVNYMYTQVPVQVKTESLFKKGQIGKYIVTYKVTL